ncbi:MAG: hypothetical protein IPK57_12040 [Chitinophagaceae bacterium]|nr:hypothetical protein [Chitinophagaceae bacterium]
MSCKVMFSQTGEIDIWGVSDDELQTAVAFLFGKQFTGKNSFISFMAGPSYTSVLYRSYQLQGNVSKKGSYAGITGGAGIKVHLGKRSAKKE